MPSLFSLSNAAVLLLSLLAVISPTSASADGAPLSHRLRLVPDLMFLLDDAAAEKAPDSEDGASPPFHMWRRNPDAERESAVRQRERRNEERGRNWLAPDAPSDIPRAEADRMHRGGILLATGIPAVLAGTLALSLTSGSGCGSAGFRGAGASFLLVGAGLSAGGIVALVRTPKRVRRAPKSSKHRGRMALAAIGSTLLSGGVVGSAGLGGLFCD